jgi:hypothetical protein
MEKLDGCFNKSADLVKRKDETWSDTNLENEFTEKDTFTRLKCRNCDGLSFEVISTGNYETAARCNNCGMYYLVHCG